MPKRKELPTFGSSFLFGLGYFNVIRYATRSFNCVSLSTVLNEGITPCGKSGTVYAFGSVIEVRMYSSADWPCTRVPAREAMPCRLGPTSFDPSTEWQVLQPGFDPIVAELNSVS